MNADANDFNTDMDTIRNYVDAVVEAKQKIAAAYAGALENVSTTFQTASPAEAQPDLLGVALKSGLKSAEKEVTKAISESTGVNLAPLVDVLHALADEVDRAAKAAANRAAGLWITDLRTTIVNNYTQGQTGEDLRNQIESEYNANDAGGRGGYIAGIENELEALRGFQAPHLEELEVAMYETWINQNFAGDCMDGTGLVYLQFNADGNPVSATVNAPLGDRVAARLNAIMATANITQVMDLDVVKKICRDSTCMCFEGNNVIRKDVLEDDVHAFLTSRDTWRQFTTFSQ